MGNIDFTAALDAEYSKIEGNAIDLKLQRDVLYNIIDVKRKNNLPDYRQSLYLDIKQYLKADTEIRSNLDYGYDQTDINKIKECIESVSVEKRVPLYSYICNLYKSYGYEYDELEQQKKQSEISLAWQNKNYVRFLLKWTSFNLTRLMIAYVIIIILLGLSMLQAPFEWMAFFTVKMDDFYEQDVINHIANTLSYFCLSDKFGPEIAPTGICGIIVYSIFWLVNFVLVGNYLTRKILEKFYIYD